MSTVRTLEIRIDQTGTAEQGVSKLSKGIGLLGGVAGAVAIGGIAALGAGLVTSFEAAKSAEAGQAELQAVLDSTGMKAGVTADMANALASALESTTKFSDDVILSAESMLLTFTNIGKDVFPTATEAVLNLGEKFGNVEQASIQVGKALNDPIAGISALTRVGVTFTDQQKEQIKAMVEAGNTAGAQKIILDELSTEFGGLAEAAGNTTAGAMAKLANRIDNLQERIGGALLPIVNALLPVFDSFLITLEDTAEMAIPVINDALTRMAQAFGVNTSKVSMTDVIVKAFKLTLDAVIIAIKLATIVIKLLADGIEMGRRNFDTMRNAATSAGNTIKSVMDGIRNAVNRAIDKIKSLAQSIRDTASSIPDWLIPGSPTPFEIGLKGIAGAADSVANTLPNAFNIPNSNTLGVNNMQMSSSIPASSVIVQFTYSPMISTASRIEAESTLKPIIEQVFRKIRK